MFHVKRLAAVALLAMALGGCAGLQTIVGDVRAVSGATVPGYAVVAASKTFDGTEVAAAAYLDLPNCARTSSPLCRVSGATPIIKGAFKSGRIARDALKVQLRAACAVDYAAGRECSAGIPVASYNTLVAATKTIEAQIAAYRTATGK